MKITTFCKSIVLICFLFVVSCKVAKVEEDNTMAKTDMSRFLGQWSFDIGSERGIPGSVGWIEILKKGEYIDANLMWGKGSVSPVPYIYLADDVLYIGRPSRKMPLNRDDDGGQERSFDLPTWLEIKIDDENLTGYQQSPKLSGIGVAFDRIKGRKLPDVLSAPDLSKLKFDEPVNLVKNHNDLTGWVVVGQNVTNGWSVTEGVITNNPVQKEGTQHIDYGNLRTEQSFEDFNLRFEVKVPKHSNSGVYLRGMFEVQIVDSYERPLNIHNSMGAIYSRIKPVVKAEKPSETWQAMDITYVNRHVTVKLNGTTIIDNQPVHGPTGGAIISDISLPGPICLQGDHGAVSYRNLILTPIIK